MGMPVAKKCQICANAATPINVYFETIEGYNNHIKDKHNNDPTKYIADAYRCNKCAQYFDDCASLTQHLTSCR